jgi:hypothetical protein
MNLLRADSDHRPVLLMQLCNVECVLSLLHDIIVELVPRINRIRTQARSDREKDTVG